MEQELKIKINGDIEGLKKATEDASKQLDTLTSAQSRVRNSIQGLNRSAMDYERQLNDLNKAYRNGVISQEKFASESERIQTSLTGVRTNINSYQRELTRLNGEVARVSYAEANRAGATQRATSATSANTAATIANTTAVQRNDNSLVRHVYAQRAALSASNNLTRSFVALSTGSGNLATNLGVATRQAASLATTATGLQGGFAALAGSLMGPGGIVIAVSAAVTALTGYIASKISAKKATDDATNANRSYIESLDGVARSQAEGEQSANRDITSLRLLYEATQNLTIPMEDRRRAAEELIRQYPKQFEGMTSERILAGEAASAYKLLAENITATAMASASLDRIRENSNKVLERRLKIIDKQNEANQLALDIERQREIRSVEESQGVQSITTQGNIVRLENRRNKILSEINELGSEMGKITAENVQLQSEYNAQLIKGADLSGSISTNLEKSARKEKEQRDQFADQLLRDENRLRIALEEGRDKELEQAKVRYENLVRLAGDNNEKLLQAADLYFREREAINAKWDAQEEEALIKGQERIQARREEIARKGASNLAKIRADENKERLKEEERIIKELERQNRRYARMLSSELSRSFEGFLSRGENVFKALGDAFKRMIIRMVAEAAALRTIQWVQGAMGSSGSGNNWGAWIRTIINVGSRFIGSGGGGGGGASGMAAARITDVGSSPTINANLGSTVFIADTRLRGQDQLIQFNRANRFNNRFNGGQ